MAYLFNYGVTYPASADIFNQNLVELIEFKAINPINILSLIIPGFNLDQIILQTKGVAGEILR